MDREKAIFKQASVTYYWSSKFFPAKLREDIFRLYSFVRLANTYVNCPPIQKTNFLRLREDWEGAINDDSFKTSPSLRDGAAARAIKNMVYLHRKYAFDPKWTEAFLDAMQSDLGGCACQTIEDTMRYMYGSAEVVGLMVSRIMRLPEAAEETARLQARAMRFVNFIRDLNEDGELGRQYLPDEDLKRFGLVDLKGETALANQAAFTKLIRFELARYRKWQAEAAAGYGHIPLRLRLPVRTAADMYTWTARQIGRDPVMVFVHKIKPTRPQVVRRAVTNLVR